MQPAMPERRRAAGKRAPVEDETDLEGVGEQPPVACAPSPVKSEQETVREEQETGRAVPPSAAAAAAITCQKCHTEIENNDFVRKNPTTTSVAPVTERLGESLQH